MDALQAIDLAKAALFLVLTVAGPMLVTSFIVGVSISLFQALTQINEMTLTFVPKLVSMGIVLLISLPMIGQALAGFMARVSDLIITG
jgi:flagellar biosynthetic protein FliQ